MQAWLFPSRASPSVSRLFEIHQTTTHQKKKVKIILTANKTSNFSHLNRKFHKIPNTLQLTSIVVGSSNDGAAENPSRSPLLDAKDGTVDSRPLVSSFMLCL